MNAPVKLKTIRGPKADFIVPIMLLTLDGQEVQVDFTCKARTKTEWAPIKKEIVAARMEELRKQAEAAIAASEADAENEDAAAKKKRTVDAWKSALDRVQEFEQTDAMALAGVANNRQAEFGSKVAAGWSLDIPMDVQSLADLEDEYPGAIESLIAKYDAAVLGAREKNSRTLP